MPIVLLRDPIPFDTLRDAVAAIFQLPASAVQALSDADQRGVPIVLELYAYPSGFRTNLTLHLVPEALPVQLEELHLGRALAARTGSEVLVNPPESWSAPSDTWALIRPDGRMYRATEDPDVEEGVGILEGELELVDLAP